MNTRFKTLIFAVDGGVARVTLNRPAEANTMNMAFMQELHTAANLCDETPEIRAVLLTGTGRFFSAGGDLKTFHSAKAGPGYGLKQAVTLLHGALSRFARMKKPLVVAVNGIAAGAGVSLAVLGDYVIAADSASFTMSYTAAGLSPDGGSTFLLPRLIGLRKTMELMLFNKTLTAQQALDWDLINEVTPADRLEESATHIVGKFANGPTQAFGSLKQLLVESSSTGLETQMEKEAREIAFNAQTQDGREGVTAFLEKRQPKFTGH